MVAVDLVIVVAAAGLSTAMILLEPTITTAPFLSKRESPQTAGYISGDPSMCFSAW
jgi:hypothetical protein